MWTDRQKVLSPETAQYDAALTHDTSFIVLSTSLKSQDLPFPLGWKSTVHKNNNCAKIERLTFIFKGNSDGGVERIWIPR